MKRGHSNRPAEAGRSVTLGERGQGGSRNRSKRAGRRFCWPRPRRLPAARRETLPARSDGIKGVLLRCTSQLINAVRLRKLSGHRQRIAQSRAVLHAVRQFKGDGYAARCLVYLRRVDPLVFEEVILSALEDAGMLVLRNRSYTGDGGIDGQVWIPGRGWHAVQSKRYYGHIDHHHVADFGAALRERGYGAGLFLHTGRSGAAVYPHLAQGKIVLVSGASLLQLVLGRCLEEAVWN